jgi:hypothetical protein
MSANETMRNLVNADSKEKKRESARAVQQLERISTKLIIRCRGLYELIRLSRSETECLYSHPGQTSTIGV